MKVLLLNIDSKLPNIALKKIEMWHQQQGDEVIWDMPIMLGQTDKAYASCIFAKNASIVANYKGLYPELIAGGTGYDLTIKLPPEIELMKPKINYGFTTRGCIRNCPFCIVPQAEGGMRIVGDVYDFWDGESRDVALLDNNILALPDHFFRICQQLTRESVRVDFNQGLDIRLVNGAIAECLSHLEYTKQLRFSFDSLNIERQFRRGMDFLTSAGVRMSKVMVFVLVGFDSSPEQDFARLEIVKEYGLDAFIMIYQEVNGVKPRINTGFLPEQAIPNVRAPRGNLLKYSSYLRQLARWVNQPHGFYKVMSFGEWIEIRGNEVESDI